MGFADDGVDVRVQGWRTLAALHARLEESLEKVLQAEFDLSVVEYTVLDAVARQDGCHMRMQHVARAAALSHSATTRLVTRLEKRGLVRRTLCDDDRRGIYSTLTEAGHELLTRARPVHDRTVSATLDEAGRDPDLAPLVKALHELPRS
ncbi:DNA-binding transcriptional regulator, MarR family [Pseudonocardia thermophila]|jgi:Transcriptional regulators|uniref:DNA-binding transcriptional regulator, MarR family n=1 Tax=Pseudonocardia thermophila TaxID=1848 RepID=A0A1M6YN43_PSETH|nr:MarR family transcriptional regulator [Pseudonocardia thermophila]SHL19449.1 DNA-binding transcriptional regulator, MarR family [Pseudonocardia thermophila]